MVTSRAPLLLCTFVALSFHQTECLEERNECWDHCKDVCKSTCCFIKLPDPSQCESFCFCSAGFVKVAVRMDCENGKAFDPDLGICMDRNETSCRSIPPSGVDCTSLVEGRFPYPHRCELFVHCSNGIEWIQRCPKGLHFSRTAKRCEHPADAGCHQEITVTTDGPVQPTTAPVTTTRIPSSTTTTVEPSSVTSPRPTSPQRPTTVVQPEVTTTPHPTTTVRPCKDDQFFPDKRNCSRYYQCSNGRLEHMTCPKDLHWCQSCKYCNYPELSGCVSKRPLLEMAGSRAGSGFRLGFRKLTRLGCPFGWKLDPKTVSCVSPNMYRQLDEKFCRSFELKYLSLPSVLL